MNRKLSETVSPPIFFVGAIDLAPVGVLFDSWFEFASIPVEVDGFFGGVVILP